MGNRPRDDCHGDGFIGVGDLMDRCTDCGGTGQIAVTDLLGVVSLAEVEMIRQGLGLLNRHQPINRRLGRAARPREIVKLGHKIGLVFREKHHEPKTQSTRESETHPQEKLPGAA